MKVKELQLAIADIEEIFDEAGARAAASDFAAVKSIFEGHEEDSVDQFIRNLRDLYNQSPAGSKAALADELVVQRCLSKLDAAADDANEFTRLLQRLDADKSVRKSEMNAIQKAFIGGREAWPTRKEALEAIRSTFERRRYTRKAMKVVEKATPW